MRCTRFRETERDGESDPLTTTRNENNFPLGRKLWASGVNCGIRPGVMSYGGCESCGGLGLRI